MYSMRPEKQKAAERGPFGGNLSVEFLPDDDWLRRAGDLTLKKDVGVLSYDGVAR